MLTNDDIRRSGATSIPEVLRLVPGVEVSRGVSNTWTIGIRGFGSSFSKSVLVLIDGRSVYTALFAGVYWDIQNVMLEDVDRIEVIRGPGGTIWGAKAVNGVINIITKDAKDTHGGLVSAAAGNIDQGIGSARYGAGNSRFSYRVYCTGAGRAPEYHLDNLNYDDWQIGRAGFRTDWNVNRQDSLTLEGEFTGQALFNLPRNFEFDATVRYISALSAQSVNSYTTMDARPGWRFAPNFDLSLVGQDPFAPRHAEFGTGVLIERAAYAKVTWSQ